MATTKQKVGVLVQALRRNRDKLAQLRKQTALERRDKADQKFKQIINQVFAKPILERPAATAKTLQKCLRALGLKLQVDPEALGLANANVALENQYMPSALRITIPLLKPQAYLDAKKEYDDAHAVVCNVHEAAEKEIQDLIDQLTGTDLAAVMAELRGGQDQGTSTAPIAKALELLEMLNPQPKQLAEKAEAVEEA